MYYLLQMKENLLIIRYCGIHTKICVIHNYMCIEFKLEYNSTLHEYQPNTEQVTTSF